MDNVYPFAAESARAIRDSINGLQVGAPCQRCGGAGSRPGIAVRPRFFPGCGAPRLPEAVQQLMQCRACGGSGTVWEEVPDAS